MYLLKPLGFKAIIILTVLTLDIPLNIDKIGQDMFNMYVSGSQQAKSLENNSCFICIMVVMIWSFTMCIAWVIYRHAIPVLIKKPSIRAIHSSSRIMASRNTKEIRRTSSNPIKHTNKYDGKSNPCDNCLIPMIMIIHNFTPLHTFIPWQIWKTIEMFVLCCQKLPFCWFLNHLEHMCTRSCYNDTGTRAYKEGAVCIDCLIEHNKQRFWCGRLCETLIKGS